MHAFETPSGRRLGLLVLALAFVLSSCDFSDSTTATFGGSPSFDVRFVSPLFDERSVGVPQDSLWSIAIDTTRGNEGRGSLKLFLDNAASNGTSSDGVIWAEFRTIETVPLAVLDAEVEFALTSLDQGDAPPWSLIIGAASVPPDDRSGLTIRGTTELTADPGDDGLAWTSKRVTFQVQTNAVGDVFLFLGIRAETADARTYLVDELDYGFAYDGYNDVTTY